MKIVSITVCRKGSVRIPNKTWEKINGKSLIERKIDQLKNVKLIDEVIVGSNDSEVNELCNDKSVTYIERPEYFCNESKCTPNEMIKNMISYVDADIIVWAHLTNPFINEVHYSNAINLFLNNQREYNSLFSVVELKEHFWNTDRKPINHNPWSTIHVVAKNLQPVYKQNGGIFIQYKKDMALHGRFVGDRPLMYTMDEKEGWDIDYPWQIEAARSFGFE